MQEEEQGGMPVPSDLMGNMMKRLFAEVRSTDADGNAVISVGWGGDIPLFPPFVGLGSLVVGLLLARILGRRPFVPAPLNLLIVRVAIFAAAVGIIAQVKSACDSEMAKQNAGVNFTPVGGIVTTGPYEYSRNPLYVAVCGLLLGCAVLFDSAWLLLSGLLFPLYVHTLVIPVEEAFLSKLFPDSYPAFLATRPRWFGPF
ncbi:hypothetical protein T484DRAFT_1880013 [Baffinella frigidus]|nr:hypothetical protein T484DRAFT_1880013 [Cryptophyta sp. CCMP2293]